jgi:hypothetical protein
MVFTILGAKGFIGPWLHQYLRSQGNTLYAPEKGDMEVFERKLGYALIQNI